MELSKKDIIDDVLDRASLCIERIVKGEGLQKDICKELMILWGNFRRTGEEELEKYENGIEYWKIIKDLMVRDLTEDEGKQIACKGLEVATLDGWCERLKELSNIYVACKNDESSITAARELLQELDDMDVLFCVGWEYEGISEEVVKLVEKLSEELIECSKNLILNSFVFLDNALYAKLMLDSFNKKMNIEGYRFFATSLKFKHICELAEHARKISKIINI